MAWMRDLDRTRVQPKGARWGYTAKERDPREMRRGCWLPGADVAGQEREMERGVRLCELRLGRDWLGLGFGGDLDQVVRI